MVIVNDIKRYTEVRAQLQPGDVIAFAGRAPISYLIHLVTGSPISHAAIVRQGSHYGSDVTVAESTLDSHGNGCRTTALGMMLATYEDGAKAWWLPLATEVRRLLDLQKFYAFIGACDRIVHYDVAGLFGFLGRELPIVGPYICQSPDPAKMFCDAYVIATLEAAGVLRGINERKMTPQDLVEMKLYREAVQLIGAPARVKRFNSV